MKKTIALLLILPLCLLFPAPSYGDGAPQVDASAFILTEMNDRHTICARNVQKRLPPASTTKIMTALIVIERLDPDTVTVVSKEAAGTEGSSAYLRAGEHITVGELLFCLMLQSANDAATALAECAAGGVRDFAALMNEKAAQIGMNNTHFTNPHGLDDEEHYTTAEDLALLTACALNNERFAALVSTKKITIGKEENARTLVNHNRLLFSLDGCVGVKTGYTIRSGRCLVSACTREQTTLICVTLNCRDDWNAHRALYNYGFSRVRRLTAEEHILTVPLVGGVKKEAELRFEGYSLLAHPGSTLETRCICPHFLFAGFKRGEKTGEVVILLDGAEAARLPLTANEDYESERQPGFFARLFERIAALFKK